MFFFSNFIEEIQNSMLTFCTICLMMRAPSLNILFFLFIRAACFFYVLIFRHKLMRLPLLCPRCHFCLESSQFLSHGFIRSTWNIRNLHLLPKCKFLPFNITKYGLLNQDYLQYLVTRSSSLCLKLLHFIHSKTRKRKQKRIFIVN